MQPRSVPLATETVPTAPFQLCLKPDRGNQWRHPAGDKPAECEWSTHINTPQHCSVCCPVHVYSDPVSRHVLVSPHPHARDHSSSALALAQGCAEKKARSHATCSTLLPFAFCFLLLFFFFCFCVCFRFCSLTLFLTRCECIIRIVHR